MGRLKGKDDPNLQGAAKDDQKLENSRVYQNIFIQFPDLSPPPQTYSLLKKKSRKQTLSRVLWHLSCWISIYLPTTADVWLRTAHSSLT